MRLEHERTLVEEQLAHLFERAGGEVFHAGQLLFRHVLGVFVQQGLHEAHVHHQRGHELRRTVVHIARQLAPYLFFHCQDAVALGPQMLIQPRVLDRERRLRRQHVQDRHIFGRERLARELVDDFQHADLFAGNDQRHTDQADRLESEALVEGIVKALVAVGMVDDQRLAVGKDPARDAAPAGHLAPFERLVCASLADGESQLIRVGVVQQQRAGFGLHEVQRAAQYLVQQRLEAGFRAEAQGHSLDRLQRGELPLDLLPCLRHLAIGAVGPRTLLVSRGRLARSGRFPRGAFGRHRWHQRARSRGSGTNNCLI